MTVLVGVRLAVGLAAASALLAACTHGQPAPVSAGTPSSSPPSSAPAVVPTSTSPADRPSRQQVFSAVRTLRQYLHAWVTDGPARASRYLEPSERISDDAGAPRISAGAIRSYRLSSWKGPGEFTLLVSMDLTFTNDPMAWNRGINSRFVTARRTQPDGYLLEFATSP